MNAATRKRLLAYAIPVDLVIVATGVGLLVPGITPLAIIVIFVVAVALSAFKSGWGGAIAAMAISGLVLFTLFKRSIETEQIGWFLAASILVSMPLAAWSNARRARRERIDKSQAVLIEPLLAAPPRSVEEEAAAALFDEGYVVQRETHARTEGERIAKAAMDADVARLRNQLERQHAEQLEQRAELQASYDRDRAELKAQFDAARLSIDAERAELQQQLDEERRRPAVIEKQLEREHAEQLERQRAEFQASYNRDRAELKAQFDAARLSIDAERAELQQQLDEERRRPAVIEKHVDEEALAQRLEHLHAEWQQQFDRELQPRIDAQLAAQRQALERDSKREIDKIQRAAEERIAALRAELDTVNAQLTALSKTPPPQPARQAAPAVQRGIFSRFFQHGPKPQLKLNRRTIAGENTATRRAAAAALAESSATRRANAARAGERKARVLFLESRRATADTAAPRLRQLGIEVAIVERLVDAVDELYRFRPDIAFIDADLSDFDKAYRTIADQAKNLPLVLTSRNAATIPDRPHAGIAVRPYIIDQVVDIARAAVNDPHSLLAKQRKAEPEPARERYDVVCYNCRVVFDAADADWCSCLTQERTVVCTNCLTCFCKGTPAYKETFWLAAPPALFERKAADLRRQSLAISANAAPSEVKRPLVMLVDADEDNQAILQRVCANLGYGSAGARNGQEGLDLARKLRPNLILADAFLPHLDGREMCRKLKEDSALAGTRIVVMTGLYADIEAKSDAVKRFR
ncbi:MAG: phosphoserine phosphatase RsbU/P, partial [Thermoanaerobaculia bacterium]|nr:phosphoserine phosphatase RsbU/P [Thermoanaerobaculia bacterium]